MGESFGARLRQQREAHNIALATIAEQTKIKVALLEALERDDLSHWPSGIFRRAYLRAYAQAIGVNPDVALREFVEVHPEPAEAADISAALATTTDTAGRNAGPPTRLHYIVGTAIGSLARLRRAPAAAHPAPEPAPAGTAGVMDAQESQSADLDLLAVAHLCTQLGRVEHASEVQPLLQEAGTILEATGLIVWVWDAGAGELRPALAYGYSPKVLAHLPGVGREADNATAAAFRSAQTCSIAGGEHASGALVVPLMAPGGCAGVLAIELPHGRENRASVRAVATIVAALLAQLVGGVAAMPEALDERAAPDARLA